MPSRKARPTEPADPRTHPEYALESEHLLSTLRTLDTLVGALQNPQSGAADEWTAAVLAGFAEEQVWQLVEARPSPYHGRLDFVPADSGAGGAFYIGKVGFADAGQKQVVTDWRAPIASLYYRGRPGMTSYRSPDGRVSGELLLKRRFDITAGELAGITDEFDLRETRPVLERAVIVDPDQFLADVLRAKTHTRLQDIVATIQQEQYELISADPDQVLTVQGAAGTGKTSIALHRLAFLLYPAAGKSAGIEARRCIIFGPNELFLSYISGVLPALKVQAIQQTTLADWSCRQMGMEPPRWTDRTLDALLAGGAPRELKAAAYRTSRLKNSRRLIPLITAHLERQRARCRPPTRGLSCGPVGPARVTARVSGAEVQRIYTELASLPFARQRERLLENLTVRLLESYRAAVGASPALPGGRADRALAEDEMVRVKRTLRQAAENEVGGYWPAFSALASYQALFSDGELWAAEGRSLFQPEEIALLRARVLPASGQIDLSDIAPLHLLFLTANGLRMPLYDHIVVDEAQDVSPLHFEILRHYSRNGSLTILGDLSQGIYSHRGFRDWSEVEPAFAGRRCSHHTLRKSYRSTREIITFANLVLPPATGERGAILAEPFERHGSRPAIHSYASHLEMARAIPALVSELRETGCANIALIVKTVEQRAALAVALRGAGQQDVREVTGERLDYSGGLVLLTVHLAKGMEFDAVLVAGADAATYGPSEYDARLLYVALTRATHLLHVLCPASLSPHLERALPEADVLGPAVARPAVAGPANPTGGRDG